MLVEGGEGQGGGAQPSKLCNTHVSRREKPHSTAPHPKAIRVPTYPVHSSLGQSRIQSHQQGPKNNYATFRAEPDRTG